MLKDIILKILGYLALLLSEKKSKRSIFLYRKFRYKLTQNEVARIGINEVSLNVIDKIADGLHDFVTKEGILDKYDADLMKTTFINGTVIGYRISATLTSECLFVLEGIFEKLKPEDLIRLREKFISFNKSNAIDFIIFRKALDIAIERSKQKNYPKKSEKNNFNF